MARRKQPVIADALLDQLLSGADAKTAFDKDGLLDELKKALAARVERGDGSSSRRRRRRRQPPQRLRQEDGFDGYC